MALEIRYICDFCSNRVSNWKTYKGWIRLFATSANVADGPVKYGCSPADAEYDITDIQLNSELDFCCYEHMEMFFRYKITKEIKNSKKEESQNDLSEM